MAKVAAGTCHSLVMSVTGEVYSFGRGRGGRLGHGMPPTNIYEPKRVSLSQRAIDCAAGSMNSAFVLSDGTVMTCGRGGDGRLGLGAETSKVFTPTHINGQIDGIVAVALWLMADER